MDNDFTKKVRSAAVIGPSIIIKGEVSGSEDLVIEGRIEGTVSLTDNTVTIGTGAEVNANVFGKIIRVEGSVNGDLTGAEQVVVHSSGQVRGNITAPRLTLEDGARLKGSIDTEPSSAEEALKSKAAAAKVTKSVINNKPAKTEEPLVAKTVALNGKEIRDTSV